MKNNPSLNQKSKESLQDQQIRDYLNYNYGLAVVVEKRHADKFTKVGLPDLNITFYGVNIQIEDKRPNEFPRDNQLKNLNEYRLSGAIVFWCDSFKMFLSKWNELVLKDPRVIYMMNNYPLGNISELSEVKEFLEYKELQLKDREEWQKIYKKDGINIIPQ
jgi:hypothetical protein